MLSSCSDPASRPVRSTARAPRDLPGAWHEVRSGETLRELAERYTVPVEDIMEINGVDRGEALRAGRQLFIPGARERSAREAIAADAGAPAARPAATTAAPVSQPGTFIWPIRGGRLTSRFGTREGRVHEGLDIAAAEGTAVLAAAAGTVMYAGSGVRGYGNLILIRHPNGMVTVYAHNRRNLVAEGDAVSQGQVIAEVGSTGKATGAHLHFEIRSGDKAVDPLEHVRPEQP